MISIQLNWDPFLSRLRLRALPRNFSLSPKNPTPALQAIIWGLKKYSFCNPYDLFTICAIRRSVDYKQVLLCFVLETGIQRTLTSNPEQGHRSIPIGSWESSCSSKKHLNSCEADAPRGGGDLGISGWGCAAGTLEPLTYTRASLAKFCYPILE